MTHAAAFAALIWWIVPIIGVSGAIGYVLWTSKYKDRYENETSRSVNNFQRFQESFYKGDGSASQEEIQGD